MQRSASEPMFSVIGPEGAAAILARDGSPRPALALARNAGFELLLGLVAIGLVSWMGTLVPALYHEG